MTGMEFAIPIMSALGTGFEALSGYQSAQNNAAIADANRRQSLLEGNNETNRRRRSNQRRLADATVAMGTQGLDPASGSIAGVLGDMAIEAEIEARAATTQGERQAQYHDAQRQQFKNQGKAALIGGALGLGSIATDAYDDWAIKPRKAP